MNAIMGPTGSGKTWWVHPHCFTGFLKHYSNVFCQLITNVIIVCEVVHAVCLSRTILRERCDGRTRLPQIQQELSYRKQIARKLRTQFVVGISVTLKSTLRVTQGHWKRNHWTDNTRLTIRRVIGCWILSWPWNVGQRSLKVIEISVIRKLWCTFPIRFRAPHFTLVKEALIEIGCVVTSLVVGCHARALWPNGAS